MTVETLVYMRLAVHVIAFTLLIGDQSAALLLSTPTHSDKLRAGDEIVVSVTAYCVDGTTKSGAQTRPGIVAADEDVLPLGSVVRLDGLTQERDGIYTVMDTGPAINGREIDIYIRNCHAAKKFGRQKAMLSVIRIGDPTRGPVS